VVAVVLVTVVVGGAVGLFARRFLRRDDDPGRASAEGLDAAELLNPLRTLVALVLAFVLVQTFASYQDAGDAATKEAGAVAAEASAAAFLPPPAAADLVGSLRCYALAVAGSGWDTLEQTRHTSAIAEQADEHVTASLSRAQLAATDEVARSEIVSADRERIDARRVRLAEAEPSVPGLVTALLIGCVGITIAGTAALAHRRMRPSLRLALVGVTAIVFTATLLVIFDLDRPFGGIAKIEPTALRGVERELAANPLAANPPCDSTGSPRAG
jgi:hypothetical protein